MIVKNLDGIYLIPITATVIFVSCHLYSVLVTASAPVGSVATKSVMDFA